MRRPPGLPRLRNCRILSCGTYGGVGSIGQAGGMGRNARVVGIEMPGAVRYARGNAKALGRKAYKVEQGDAKSVLTPGRLVKLGPKPMWWCRSAACRDDTCRAAACRGGPAAAYIPFRATPRWPATYLPGSGFPPESRQACGLVPQTPHVEIAAAWNAHDFRLRGDDESHRHQQNSARRMGILLFSSRRFCGAEAKALKRSRAVAWQALEPHHRPARVRRKRQCVVKQIISMNVH